MRLQHGRIGVRPLVRRDAQAWARLRGENVSWLAEWEASLPAGSGEAATSYAGMVRGLRTRARRGQAMPFVITYDGAMVGQLTVNSITWGSARSASLGYWVTRAFAGQQITPTAVALVIDHLFAIGLHRIEISIRPENQASLRIVEKLGFRQVGLARKYLHIAGDWRDHRVFQLVVEDAAGGVLSRL